MSFTYTNGTPIGKIRLLICDTDKKNAIFTDEELQEFIDMEPTSFYMAAARAYGAIIRSRARLALIVKRDGYQTQEHALADLRGLVKDMENQARSLGGIQVDTMPLSDENFESFRPGWRDIGQEVTE